MMYSLTLVRRREFEGCLRGSGPLPDEAVSYEPGWPNSGVSNAWWSA